MVRVFIAGFIAMVVSVVIGPKFIAFLRRNELGQPIREDGPAGHVVKQGTPVMEACWSCSVRSCPSWRFRNSRCLR